MADSEQRTAFFFLMRRAAFLFHEAFSLRCRFPLNHPLSWTLRFDAVKIAVCPDSTIEI